MRPSSTEDAVQRCSVGRLHYVAESRTIAGGGDGSAEVTGRSGAPLEFLRPDGGMRLPDLGDAVAMPDGQHDSARPAEVDLDDRMRGVAGTLPVGRALVALEGPRDGHDQVLGRLRQLLELRTC